MLTIPLVCLILALFCFSLAAFRSNDFRYSLRDAGYAFVVAAVIFTRVV